MLGAALQNVPRDFVNDYVAGVIEDLIRAFWGI